MDTLENINELAHCAEAINNGEATTLSAQDSNLLEQDDQFAAMSLEIAEIAAEYSREKNIARPNKTLIFSISAVAALLAVVLCLKFFQNTNNISLTAENTTIVQNPTDNIATNTPRANGIMGTAGNVNTLTITPKNIKQAAKIEIYDSLGNVIFCLQKPQFPLTLNTLPIADKQTYAIFNNDNIVIEKGNIER